MTNQVIVCKTPNGTLVPGPFVDNNEYIWNCIGGVRSSTPDGTYYMHFSNLLEYTKIMDANPETLEYARHLEIYIVDPPEKKLMTGLFDGSRFTPVSNRRRKRPKIISTQTILENKDPPRNGGVQYLTPVETAPIPSPNSKRKAEFEQRRLEGEALERAWGKDESGRTIPRRSRSLVSAASDNQSDVEDTKPFTTSSLRSWFGKSSRVD